MQIEELKVTLTFIDIIEITNDMNNIFPEKQKPSQGFLEYCLCKAILNYKKVNFFEYQRLIQENDDKKKTSASEISYQSIRRLKKC